jgi:hypothetical protein
LKGIIALHISSIQHVRWLTQELTEILDLGEHKARGDLVTIKPRRSNASQQWTQGLGHFAVVVKSAKGEQVSVRRVSNRREE